MRHAMRRNGSCSILTLVASHVAWCVQCEQNCCYNKELRILICFASRVASSVHEASAMEWLTVPAPITWEYRTLFCLELLAPRWRNHSEIWQSAITSNKQRQSWGFPAAEKSQTSRSGSKPELCYYKRVGQFGFACVFSFRGVPHSARH